DVLAGLAERAEGAATVVGDHRAHVHRVDALRVHRVDEDLLVVQADRGIVALLAPRRAAVVGAEGAAAPAGRFDDRIHDVWVRRRTRETDSALTRRDDTDLTPGLAAVGGAVQAALRTARDIAEEVT